MSSEPRSPLPLSALCVHSTELKLLYKIGFALSRLCFVFISGKRWRRHLPYDHEHVHGHDHEGDCGRGRDHAHAHDVAHGHAHANATAHSYDHDH